MSDRDGHGGWTVYLRLDPESPTHEGSGVPVILARRVRTTQTRVSLPVLRYRVDSWM